jgi:hypothetical protein
MPQRRRYDWEYSYGDDEHRTPDQRARDEQRNRAASEDSRDDPWLTGYGGGTSGSTTGYGGGGGGGGVTPPAQWQQDVADIPVLGWLSGASDAQARYQDQTEAARNRQYWHDLGASAPSVDALTPETFLEGSVDEYGNLIGDPSQLEGFGPSSDQRASLEALRRLSEGGLTEADRNMSRALRDQQAMQMGANSRAAQQQMQARGMGGSGAELAMRMGTADSMAGANSMADAQLQQSAQMRAMQALQSWQGGANTVQSQELARRNALDAFNQANTGWRRGREERNTAWTNRGAENRAQAQQQAYANRRDVAAGATNQYSTDASGRNAQRDRERERDQGIIGAVGEILDF